MYHNNNGFTKYILVSVMLDVVSIVCFKKQQGLIVLMYIHGFNSSPMAPKGQIIQRWLRHRPYRLYLPNVACPPLEAMTKLIRLTEQAQKAGESLRFIGSSLGGFFATYLCEMFDGHAVLINPAVRPDKLWHRFLGRHYNPYTGQYLHVTSAHAAALKQFEVHTLQRPQNMMVLLKQGDEVLDYQWAVQKYSQSQLLIEEGGDHTFHDFERHQDTVTNFLNLT